MSNAPDESTNHDEITNVSMPGEGPVEFIESLTDDATPEATPKDAPVFRTPSRRPPTHDQSTRKLLAMTLLIPTVLFYGAAIGGRMAHWIAAEDFTAILAGVSGFQALTAAAIGFYFAKPNDNKAD